MLPLLRLLRRGKATKKGGGGGGGGVGGVWGGGGGYTANRRGKVFWGRGEKARDKARGTTAAADGGVFCTILGLVSSWEGVVGGGVAAV